MEGLGSGPFERDLAVRRCSSTSPVLNVLLGGGGGGSEALPLDHFDCKVILGVSLLARARTISCPVSLRLTDGRPVLPKALRTLSTLPSADRFGRRESAPISPMVRLGLPRPPDFARVGRLRPESVSSMMRQ